MPGFNPCCFCSLRTGVQVIAILNIVISLIGIILKGFFLGSTLLFFALAFQSTVTLLIIPTIVGIHLLVNLIQFFIGIILLSGVNEKEIKKCQSWIITTIILLILYIIKTFIELVFVQVYIQEEIYFVVTVFQLIFVLIFEIYQITVVWAYVDELKTERIGFIGPVSYTSSATPTTTSELMEAGGSSRGPPPSYQYLYQMPSPVQVKLGLPPSYSTVVQETSTATCSRDAESEPLTSSDPSAPACEENDWGFK